MTLLHRSAPADQHLTSSLALKAVGELAPEELTLFEAANVRFFRRRLWRTRRRDDLLGFGTDSIVALTPGALWVASFVARVVFQELEDDAQGFVHRAVRRALRRFRKRPAVRVEALAELSDVQLEQVRNKVLIEMSSRHAPEIALRDDQIIQLVGVMVHHLRQTT